MPENNTDKTNTILPSEFKSVTEELYKRNLELVTLYKKVDTLNHELELANEGQSNLIHVMNHQIKGYLAKARGIFSELLEEPAYGPVSPAAIPMLKVGFDTLTEGVGFVQQVLNGSSAESGAMVYNMKPLNFKELVNDVVTAQHPHVDEKALSVELVVDDGNYTMTGDSINLKEVVRNLIDNSIIYTEAGGLYIHLQKIKDEKVLLTIKDTGLGIDPEDMKRLFTKGGRGKDSLKINVNSSGYGLAFVRGVAEAHKGRAWAESAGKGQGSTFYLELPTTLT